MAQAISEQYNCVVSVSGEVDAIVAGREFWRVANGHPLMPRVTGLGCTASALTAAFCAVNPSPVRAATHALVVMGIAGEVAAAQCAGPGGFVPHFLDALYLMDQPLIESRLRLNPPEDR